MKISDNDSHDEAYDNEEEASAVEYCYGVSKVKIKGIIYYIPTFE